MTDDPQTIGEGKAKRDALKERIQTLEGIAPPDHVENLREELADLEARIETSKQDARRKNAIKRGLGLASQSNRE